MSARYETIRMFATGRPCIVIDSDLTLEEAQDHCNDKETSSTTCTSDEGAEITRVYGDWFDGYREQ